MLGEDEPVVVLDVGGTTLAAAVVVGDDVVATPVRGSSRQDADGRTITDCFAAAISAASARHDVALTVVAMPAPFDYERGISHMTHKFAALAGVDVGAALEAALGAVPGVTRPGRVVFINDAEAAALGAWVELGRPATPVAVVTLGTGVGSGLIESGVSRGHNELWTEPYLDGIVEDRVSSEALRADYERRTGRDVGVAEIAALAASGEAAAIEAFATYGDHLGAAVGAYFADAGVESIAVTGGVTGAWRHIEPAATAAYRAAGGTGELVRATSEHPALVGGAEFGRRRLRGRA